MGLFSLVVIVIEVDCCFFFLGTLLERFQHLASKISLHLIQEDLLNGTLLTQMAMNLSIKLRRNGSLLKEIYIDSELLNDEFYGASNSD